MVGTNYAAQPKFLRKYIVPSMMPRHRLSFPCADPSPLSSNKELPYPGPILQLAQLHRHLHLTDRTMTTHQSFRHSPRHNTQSLHRVRHHSHNNIHVPTPTTPLPPGSPETPAGHATPLIIQAPAGGTTPRQQRASPYIPPHHRRSGRQKTNPRWHADYDME